MNTRAMKTPKIARSIHAGVLVLVFMEVSMVLVSVVRVGVGVGVSGERLVVARLVAIVAVEEDEAVGGDEFACAEDDEADCDDMFERTCDL